MLSHCYLMELLSNRFSLFYFSFHDDPDVYFLVDERSELQAGQFNFQPHAALKLEYTFQHSWCYKLPIV